MQHSTTPFAGVKGEDGLMQILNKANEHGVHHQIINCTTEDDDLCSNKHITVTDGSKFKIAFGPSFYSGHLTEVNRRAHLAYGIGKLAVATHSASPTPALAQMAETCKAYDTLTAQEHCFAEQYLPNDHKLGFSCDGRHLAAEVTSDDLEGVCGTADACKHDCLYSSQTPQI